jgi:membrane-associated protein
MLMSIVINGTADTAPSLLGPSLHSGPWFYLILFLVILLGAVFIVTLVPENSILFLAGALAVRGQVSLGWVLAVSVAGAYVGYDLNYWTAKAFSLAVCRRYCPRVLHAKNIEKARGLIERFGPVSVVISRFIPAVNLPPFMAGLDSMDYRWYAAVNLFGAVLWCGITVFLGYFIGSLDIIQDYANLLFDLVLLLASVACAYAAATLIRERGKDIEAPA